ncbi:MAG: hypothetical protein VSS75_013195 [Candidatus Parabeggiatoa sp.]|nr:hypothetical protein [Candidatus Parabeggiatoa sp.]
MPPPPNFQTLHQLVQLAKGYIQPQDLRIGGDLKPEAATRIINMIMADHFLSKITVERMQKLKKEIYVWDILPRQLRRIPQGQEPTENEMPGLQEYGWLLDALSVQLFPTISLDTLRDNADNPNMVTNINSGFNTRIQNDLVDLAINGTSEAVTPVTEQSQFETLNKGWLQITAEETHTKKITLSGSTWIDKLAAVRKASDYRFRPDSVFIMNPDDADEYDIEIGKHVTGAAIITNQTDHRFLRQRIESCQFMPAGKLLYTPLKNLIMGISVLMRRDSTWHARKRVLEITYDMAVDFGIAIKHACVIGTTV